jgi:ubiquinone/menaquinone biosynthesis C-methylase UbiE
MIENSYEMTYSHENHYWWFTARLDIFTSLFENLREKGLIPRNAKILNLGCGTGIQTEIFSKFGEVVSLDFSEDALKFCGIRKLGRLVRADAGKLPFAAASFDVVLCFDILEHIESDLTAVSEINRVLKKNGIAFISVPAFRFLWSSFDDVNWHKRRYRKKEVEKLISGSGLIPFKTSYFNFFLFPLALMRRSYEKVFKRRENQYYLPKTGLFSNYILKKVFASEKYFLNHLNFPCGVSVIGIARKP